MVFLNDQTPDTFFEHLGIEIDQQPDSVTGKLEIGYKHRIVDGGKRFD